MQLKNFSSLVLGQAGDTIIEVLIAVAVCAVALGGAYVAVNHSVKGVENQQEHNQAIKLVESQVEDLRAYAGSTTSYTCFVYDSTSETIQPETPTDLTQGNNPCILQSNGDQATANSEPAYSISISSNMVDPTTITYTISVQWQNLEGSTSQISMDYRPQ